MTFVSDVLSVSYYGAMAFLSSVQMIQHMWFEFLTLSVTHLVIRQDSTNVFGLQTRCTLWATWCLGNSSL